MAWHCMMSKRLSKVSIKTYVLKVWAVPILVDLNLKNIRFTNLEEMCPYSIVHIYIHYHLFICTHQSHKIPCDINSYVIFSLIFLCQMVKWETSLAHAVFQFLPVLIRKYSIFLLFVNLNFSDLVMSWFSGISLKNILFTSI